MKQQLLFIAFIISVSIGSNAQVEVIPANVPPYTPTTLIENVFLGDGVQILNVSYQGNDASFAYFEDAEDDIGIERGIVMTTGLAKDVNGLNCPKDPSENMGLMCGNNGKSGESVNHASEDPDLALITQNDINDAVIYEIEFIPFSDTLQFQYVFASEEYPEYVCSPFNDVFGFFISGQGFNGPYEDNAENIALIPSTNLPVAINTVNGGTVGTSSSVDIANCQSPLGSLDFSDFFNNNPEGNANAEIIYDGFTTVLTAQAVVTPCETYKIKLALGDVQDGDFDSGVFLAAKSFGTGSIKVEQATSSIDGTIAENCQSGQIILTLPFPASSNIPLSYRFFGEASNGVDFQTIPNNLSFPIGKDSLIIDIFPILDAAPEGIESFFFEIQKNVCQLDTVRMSITDYILETPVLPETETICEGDNIALDATLSIVPPSPPNFTHSSSTPIIENTPLLSIITVDDVLPDKLVPNLISSICLTIDHPNPNDLEISLITPSGNVLALSSRNGGSGTCDFDTPKPTDGYFETCFVPFDAPPIDSIILDCSNPAFCAGLPVCPNLAPFTGNWSPEGNWEDIYYGNSNGDYQLLILDDQVGFDGNLVEWSINFQPTYAIGYIWEPITGLSCNDCPNPIATPTTSTTYTVTVFDSYGCEESDQININVLDKPEQPIVQCGIATTNSISIEWNDVPLASDYEVSIDGTTWVSPSNSLSHEFTGLMNNTSYTFYVRAVASNCGNSIGDSGMTSCSTIRCGAAYDLDNLQHISCLGDSDGLIEISVSGASPFSYQLLQDLLPIGITQNTGQFSDLIAGTYQIQITDNTNCVDTTQSFIIENAIPIVTDTASIAETCLGQNDGQAIIIATGGKYPYTYLWNTSPSQSDSIATNLTQGDYIVTVTDDSNCIAIDTVIINTLSTPNISPTSNSPICEGDTLKLEMSGGITYSWSGPENFTSTLSNPTLANTTILNSGEYVVTVSTVDGCDFSKSLNVNIISSNTLTLTSNSPVCKNGFIELVAQGGANYKWSGPNGFTSNLANPTFDANNLQAGTLVFTCTTQAGGCSTSKEITVSILEEISQEVSISPPSCRNASDASVTITNIEGGLGTNLSDYTIEWSTNPTITGLTANNLAADSRYFVTITDNNSCFTIDTIDIMNPDGLEITIQDIKDVSCFNGNNGTIDVNAINGELPYIYQWSNGASTPQITDLTANTYSLTISDANNCSISDVYVINQPDSITIDFQKTDIGCVGIANGTIQLNPNGGTAPYSYLWDSGETSAFRDNLGIGAYFITVSDANNCINSTSIDIIGLDSLEINTEPIPPTCFGGTNGIINIDVSGGLTPYQYSIDGTNFSNQSTIRNLSSGTYNVFVKDANDCIQTLNSITVDAPLPIEILIDGIEEDGEIFIDLGDSLQVSSQINESIGNITYQWQTNGRDTLSCTDCPNPLIYPSSTANYTLLVKDERNCTQRFSFKIVVDKERSIYVPTAFTPNNDGINDFLQVHGKTGTTILLFRVYDRWGEKVFEASNFEVNSEDGTWNGIFKGEPMNPAVFVWHIEAEFLDGRKAVFVGNSTLIR